MKLCLSFLIVALFASLAEARLGDSESDLVNRYGTSSYSTVNYRLSKRESFIHLPNAKTFAFEKVRLSVPDSIGGMAEEDKFSIEATIIDGRTERMVYSTSYMFSPAVRYLLGLNAPVHWSDDSEYFCFGQTYETDDKEFIANYEPYADRDYLFVTTSKFRRIVEQQRQDDERILNSEKQKKLDELIKKYEDLGQ